MPSRIASHAESRLYIYKRYIATHVGSRLFNDLMRDIHGGGSANMFSLLLSFQIHGGDKLAIVAW